MKYLSYFILPTKELEDDYLWELGNTCQYYPFRVLSQKQLEKIEFEPITIFHGGNGSGKSTLLNVIAGKTGVERSSVYNRSACFQDYVDLCKMMTFY